MQITVTKHAKQRLKERSGARGATAERKATMALEHGLTMEEVEGSLRKYLVHLYCTHGEIGQMRLYNYQIYCFDEDALITVYNLPKQYANAFERARKKRSALAETEAKDEKEKEPMKETGLVDLLSIQVTDEKPVSGRELHERLGIGTAYTVWFGRMCDYGFEAGKDFETDSKNVIRADGAIMPQSQEDHSMTLSMAKEICMLQRTEKGRELRRYLIRIEEAWNSEDAVVARALQIQTSRVQELNGRVLHLTAANSELTSQVERMRPSAAYADIILKNPGLVTITQIAKDYGISGQAMNRLLHKQGVQYKQSGQWLLYAKYAGKGYVHSETFPITHRDGRQDVTMETKWTQKGRMFLYEFLRDKTDMLPLIERAQSA